MVVVNTPESFDPKIAYLKFQKPVQSFLNLLDEFSAPNKKLGVKRNNYYLFALDAVYAIPLGKIDNEYKFFMMLCRKASNKFTHIMFAL